MNNDKLIIGGYEFNSRFILGSGKYSMKLIEAAVKDAGAQMITLAVRRAIRKNRKAFWIIFPRESHCFPILQEQEMPAKPCVLPGLPEKWDAEILLKLKLCAIQNICFPTIRKP